MKGSAHAQANVYQGMCARACTASHVDSFGEGEMSERREEVYLAATDLTARRGHRHHSVSTRPLLLSDAPWASPAPPRASARTCTSTLLTVMCVVRD